MRIYLIIFIVVIINVLNAQHVSDTTLLPNGANFSGAAWEGVIGYSYQKGHYLEVGFGRNVYGVNYHPFFGAISVGSEFYLKDISDHLVFAPKISARLSGGSAFGISLLNYTDMKNNCVALRPEIGVGVFWFFLGYGYNIRMSNTSFEIPVHHVFFLTLHLFKMKTDGIRSPS
jgi:hypothetical protein